MQVLEIFSQICQIPRPSKHEERISQWLQDFAREHHIECVADEAMNVILRVPATAGYEDHPTLILQAHMDMVCEKNSDCDHNFMTDPIETYVDGDWLKARGTTLGADNGIGIAMALAAITDPDLQHPAIECLFTVDEETGLTGAMKLQDGYLRGTRLINLDSEDDGQIFIGCAGGIDTLAKMHYTPQNLPAPEQWFPVRLSVSGLMGGHSGDDIDKKRANAIKILARFLYLEMEKMPIRLAQFNSGKMHNAIPRDGKFKIAVPTCEKETVRVDWNIFISQVEEEYHVTDSALEASMQSTEAEKVLPKSMSDNFIRAMQAVDNGVFAICQDEALGGMVETSSNIASIVTEENCIKAVSSQRSNVMSNLDNMCNTIKALFELAGASVEQNDGYPAWKMNPNSQLTKTVVDTYKRLFGKDPIVRGIHAGLECGLFSERYPNLDMVSFGPTLRFVHTPEERIHIPTVQMVWDHLLAVLKEVPVK